ncbi:hypothetical protein PtrV1_07427 [Pyrenophora tritici-repentis]|uniref:Uncharacterized protein n=1 Tax=Pyrenophora tritici-repentis TaxID=45151 RepID=A0A5M9LE26_9PLEO|nr:hypothetical protein PtrV1_07427 [Pyrenophora tritici-repentis]KAF7572208.1 hypothetical protein PtrM4_097080 [Pyrenophora tritici-repentis]PZC98604.1 hypothetical protein A1F95_04060 [Pyrenophora tritici-repentis]
MADRITSSTQSENNTCASPIARPTPIARAMIDGSVPTGFVASRVNEINMAIPYAYTTGSTSSPVPVPPDAPQDQGRQAGLESPTTHLSATRYRRRSANNHNPLPSQIESRSPRISLSRYRPVACGRQISTPAISSAMDNVTQGDASRRVSMPLPATSGLGISRSEGYSTTSTLGSQAFDGIAAINSQHLRGHQRNRTEISDITKMDRSCLGSALSNQTEGDSCLPSAPYSSASPQMHNESASSGKEGLMILPSQALERRASTDSLDSTSTFESGSWNPAPTDGPGPDRPLRRVAKFNLETGSCSHTPMAPVLEDMRTEEAQGLYPPESVQYGGVADGCRVYDFAYPKDSRGKHVRFASKSDHAPSVNYNSSSESCASTRAVCGRKAHQNKDWKDEIDCEQEDSVKGIDPALGMRPF